MAQSTDFMELPLVEWVKTFNQGSEPLHFEDFADGVFLNEVFNQIDTRPPTRAIHKQVENANQRIHNFDILIEDIKSFYEVVLDQIVVMQLPNIVVLGKDHVSEAGTAELQKVLHLILGCAVQCEKKEPFINNIKQLCLETQHVIVGYIQEITDNTDNVLNRALSELAQVPEEEHETMYRCLFHHVQRLVKERDGLLAMVAEELQGLPVRDSAGGMGGPASICNRPTTPEVHHMLVELADCKSKVRRLRQEVEEKQEAMLELREEMEQKTEDYNKLRQEQLELVQEARASRTYRDELDVIKEKASKVDKLEAELIRYKEKLNELDFYKTRVEELREDSQILIEAKNLLEDQLEASQKRAETVVDLEADLAKLKEKVVQMESEKEADKERMHELLEENTQLQFDKNNSIRESANLGAELATVKSQSPTKSSTLSDQMHDHATAIRLQMENKKLMHELDQLQNFILPECNTKIIDLEKDNQRMCCKVEKLQEISAKDAENFVTLQHEAQTLQRSKEQLVQSMDTVKENNSRQVMQLERENQQLSQSVENIRARSQKTTDTRLKEVEMENKRLHDTVKEVSCRLSNAEFEKKQLEKSQKLLAESFNRAEELDKDNERLQQEICELKNQVTTLKLTCDKYEKLEKENCELEVENRRLKKMLGSLQSSSNRLEQLEKENINLNVENQKLTRVVESVKSSSNKVVEMEQEKDQAKRRIQQLEKTLEVVRVEREKYDQLEIDLMELDSENQRMHKLLDSTVSRIEELQKDCQEVESENQKLRKSVETLKVTCRKLNNVEKENQDLEAENSRSDKERKFLDKENSRLRNGLELKEAQLDEMSGKLSALEKENRRFLKVVDKCKDSELRTKYLEKEHRDVVQQSTTDKKTLATLREDLVNEKIRTQQLSNDLEKMNTELEKIGLNREKLIAAEQAHDESRYKALESMMEEAIRKTMEIKEEKIVALEGRLLESVNRNQRLREDLHDIRRQYEALQQRREEEELSASPKNQVKRSPSNASTTKEILQLKDHLVELERNNATLLEEKKNLHAQFINVNEHLKTIQEQTSQLRDTNSTLQANTAKYQVENTTISSQLSSTKAQLEVVKKKNVALEVEREKLVSRQEEIMSTHEALLKDHEILQKLHEQLSGDYETLISELGTLKSAHKMLKCSHRELKIKFDELAREKDIVAEMKETIAKEKEIIHSDAKSLNNLKLEYFAMKEDLETSKKVEAKCKADYRNLQLDFKKIKTEYNNMRLRYTELQGELADARDQLTCMDIDFTKLASRCEMLNQINITLEEENKTLMNHISSLLNQNQLLMHQTIENKDQFHEEEKAFIDKLNDLRRQKEKLEEKIMDQYRRMDSVNKKKGLGERIARRAKGFMQRQGGRPKTPNGKKIDGMDGPDSPDNSSQGSTGPDSSLRFETDSEAEACSGNSTPVRRANRSSPPQLAANALHRKSMPNPSLSDCGSSIDDFHLRGSLSSDELHSSKLHDEPPCSPCSALSSCNLVNNSKGLNGYEHNLNMDNIPTKDVGPCIPHNFGQDKRLSDTKISLRSSQEHLSLNARVRRAEARAANENKLINASLNSLNNRNYNDLNIALKRTQLSSVSMGNIQDYSMKNADPQRSSTPQKEKKRSSVCSSVDMNGGSSHEGMTSDDGSTRSSDITCTRVRGGKVSSRVIVNGERCTPPPPIPARKSSPSNTAGKKVNGDAGSHECAGSSITTTTNNVIVITKQTPSSPTNSQPDSQTSEKSKEKKENSIWYEYGCV